LRKGIVLGIAVLIGVLAPASADAKGKPKTGPLPDLLISKIVIPEFDPFAFSVVHTDGQMTPIKVHVTTWNAGKASTKHSSITEVFFKDSSGRYFKEGATVPPLKAGKRITKIITIPAEKPALGFARLGAAADYGEQIHEVSERNNFGPPGDDPFSNSHKGIKFAIVAKEWHPTDFETSGSAFPATLRTYSAGLRYVLSTIDRDGYNYRAYGSVSNSAMATGFCSGSDLETRSHNPWEKGDLRINSDLDGYYASVLMGPTEHYSITITCFGVPGSHTEEHDFLDLETYAGERGADVLLQKATNATRLQGTYTNSALHTTWTWDLHAAIG
jgi:CARDB